MEAIVTFLLTLSPLMVTILTVLGTIVVISTSIDALVDDQIDKGFSKKILAIPYLGAFLKELVRLSIFRNKKK